MRDCLWHNPAKAEPFVSRASRPRHNPVPLRPQTSEPPRRGAKTICRSIEKSSFLATSPPGACCIQAIAPVLIHSGSVEKTSGSKWIHLHCPPPFRHQKTPHVPVSPFLTAVSSFPRKSRPARGKAPGPADHTSLQDDYKTRRSFRSCLCSAPPVRTRPRDDCLAVTRRAPARPTRSTLISLPSFKAPG